MTHNTQNFEERIREQGHRFTLQRKIILDTLCEIGTHATANEIYEKIILTAPTINRATVYRGLSFFCELNLLVSGKIEGKTIYEIASPTPHHHLICTQCGHVGILPDRYVQGLINQLIEEHQFKPDIEHLTISGLCAECQ